MPENCRRLPHQLQEMDSLASSPEFVYGNFNLILDEDNEIAQEGVQQILEVLNTDIERFNGIINSVFEENKLGDTTTSCEPKKENIDPEPDTKEEPPAVKANSTLALRSLLTVS